MIDTATIRFKLSLASVKQIVPRLLSLVPEEPPPELLQNYSAARREELARSYNNIHSFDTERFFSKPNALQKAPYLLLLCEHIPSMNPGIKAITIYRQKIYGSYYTDEFYISITIALEQLIAGKPTVELFRPSVKNNAALQDAYAAAIYYLFPEAFCLDGIYSIEELTDLAALPYLGAAKVNEVAFTVDFRPDDLALTKKLVDASVRTFSLNNAELDNDNTYLYTKSRCTTIDFYDKLEKFNTQGVVDAALIAEATGRYRFEFTKYKPTRAWIQNNFHVDINDGYYQLGILPFLNEKFADDVLYGYYDKFLGFEDWYSSKAIETMVNNADLSTRAKNELLTKTLPAISQARSVEAARSKCVTDSGYSIRTGVVKFSEASFRTQLKNARQAGVQPLTLPRNWARDHDIYKSVDNPIKKIVFPKEHDSIVELEQVLSKEEFAQYSKTVKYFNEELQRRRKA